MGAMRLSLGAVRLLYALSAAPVTEAGSNHSDNDSNNYNYNDNNNIIIIIIINNTHNINTY